MAHWLLFFAIGLIAAIVQRRGRWSLRGSTIPVVGTLLGGGIVVTYAPPSIARLGSLLAAAIGAACAIWVAQPQNFEALWRVPQAAFSRLKEQFPWARLERPFSSRRILGILVLVGLLWGLTAAWVENRNQPAAELVVMGTRMDDINRRGIFPRSWRTTRCPRNARFRGNSGPR